MENYDGIDRLSFDLDDKSWYSYVGYEVRQKPGGGHSIWMYSLDNFRTIGFWRKESRYFPELLLTGNYGRQSDAKRDLMDVCRELGAERIEIKPIKRINWKRFPRSNPAYRNMKIGSHA